jgi:hypothetical protein
MKFQIPAFVAADENKIFKGSNWFIVKKKFQITAHQAIFFT